MLIKYLQNCLTLNISGIKEEVQFKGLEKQMNKHF
nr:MAG TPA: hypothetical protein [Crassvirales sp.]